MERQEIIAGIKSALERGYSLNLAIQSFINAGYNRQDVEDSARSLGGEVSYIASAPRKQEITKPQTLQAPQQTSQQIQKPIQQVPLSPVKPLEQFPAQPVKVKKKGLIFAIIILIIVLVLLLSALFTFIFAKDFAVSLIEKLGYNI